MILRRGSSRAFRISRATGLRLRVDSLPRHGVPHTAPFRRGVRRPGVDLVRHRPDGRIARTRSPAHPPRLTPPDHHSPLRHSRPLWPPAILAPDPRRTSLEITGAPCHKTLFLPRAPGHRTAVRSSWVCSLPSPPHATLPGPLGRSRGNSTTCFARVTSGSGRVGPRAVSVSSMWPSPRAIRSAG